MVPPSYLRVKQLKADHKLSAYVRYWKICLDYCDLARSSHFTWKLFNISVYRFLFWGDQLPQERSFQFTPWGVWRSRSHQHSRQHPQYHVELEDSLLGIRTFIEFLFSYDILKESIPRQVDKKSGVPEKKKSPGLGLLKWR